MFETDMLKDLNTSIKLNVPLNMYISHPPLYFEEKTKYEYTLWSISKGSVYIKINGNLYSASEGDIVMFRPGISYIFYSDSYGCEFMFEQLSLFVGDRFDLLGALDFSGIIRKEYMGDDSVRFCEYFKDRCYWTSDTSLASYSVILSYLSKICDILKMGNKEDFSGIPERTNSDIYRAMSYISERFTRKIPTKELSLKFGFSEKYFIHLFKTTLGISPNQYRIRCCMRYAEFLLAHTDKKIKEIASILGYSDIYAFSKAFKNEYGESPLTFKSKLKPNK